MRERERERERENRATEGINGRDDFVTRSGIPRRAPRIIISICIGVPANDPLGPTTGRGATDGLIFRPPPPPYSAGRAPSDAVRRRQAPWKVESRARELALRVPSSVPPPQYPSRFFRTPVLLRRSMSFSDETRARYTIGAADGRFDFADLTAPCKVAIESSCALPRNLLFAYKKRH